MRRGLAGPGKWVVRSSEVTLRIVPAVAVLIGGAGAIG